MEAGASDLALLFGLCLASAGRAKKRRVDFVILRKGTANEKVDMPPDGE